MAKYSATISRTFSATFGSTPGEQRARNSASEIGGYRSSKSARLPTANTRQNSTATRRKVVPTKNGIIGSAPGRIRELISASLHRFDLRFGRDRAAIGCDSGTQHQRHVERTRVRCKR